MEIKEQKIEQFLKELSGKNPTPGGGAVAALAGAMAASLVSMVAALTIGKIKYIKVDKTMKEVRREAGRLQRRLMFLADADVKAFNEVITAYKSKNNKQIMKALQKAIDVPEKVAQLARKVEKLGGIVVILGNKNAASDAKSAIHLAQAAIKSADENIKLNRQAIEKL